eukprot:Rhum_TRINITY_DN14508_c2_g1::Rhum_TRINITY_DN14508_c2_g1_i1::g.94715::m.94715
MQEPMHEVPQSFGVLNWSRELLLRLNIKKAGKVMDWQSDGVHFGKYTRVGDGDDTCSVDELVIEGYAADMVTAWAQQARHRAAWTVTPAVSTPGLPVFSDDVKTGDFGAVCSLGDVMSKRLGETGWAYEFFTELRSVLRDGGLLTALVVDSGVLYRRGVLESKQRNGYASEAHCVSIDEATNASGQYVFTLHVKGEEGPRFKKTPMYNLTEVLKTAELCGFEVMECTNLIELLYRYGRKAVWNELLTDGYKVISRTGRNKQITSPEKAVIGMYSTLVLRKRQRTPVETWAAHKAAILDEYSGGGGGGGDGCPSPDGAPLEGVDGSQDSDNDSIPW